MSKRRVVVTGLGLISPVGNTRRRRLEQRPRRRQRHRPDRPFRRQRVHHALRRHHPQLRPRPVPRAEGSAQVRPVHALRHRRVDAGDPGLRARQSRKPTRIAMASRWAPASAASARSKRTIRSGSKAGRARSRRSSCRARIINMISGHVSIKYGLTGPNLAVVTACTTSTHCIGWRRGSFSPATPISCSAGGAEYRDDAVRSRRLLRGARVVDAQRRPEAREPTVGSRSRRLRAERRRRLHRARGVRARQGARRAHLRRVRRLRHERRRVSHHGAAGERAGRLSMHGQRHARRRA